VYITLKILRLLKIIDNFELLPLNIDYFFIPSIEVVRSDIDFPFNVRHHTITCGDVARMDKKIHFLIGKIFCKIIFFTFSFITIIICYLCFIIYVLYILIILKVLLFFMINRCHGYGYTCFKHY